MSENFRTHSAERVNPYNGLLVLTSLAMTLGIFLLPIDIWSRAALLVWSLMVMHMSISMMRMLREDRQVKIPVRDRGDDRGGEPRRTDVSNRTVL